MPIILAVGGRQCFGSGECGAGTWVYPRLPDSYSEHLDDVEARLTRLCTGEHHAASRAHAAALQVGEARSGLPSMHRCWRITGTPFLPAVAD